MSCYPVGPSVQKDEAVGVDLLDLNDLNFPNGSWNFSAPRRYGMELPLGENDPTTVETVREGNWLQKMAWDIWVGECQIFIVIECQIILTEC